MTTRTVPPASGGCCPPSPHEWLPKDHRASFVADPVDERCRRRRPGEVVRLLCSGQKAERNAQRSRGHTMPTELQRTAHWVSRETHRSLSPHYS